MNNNDIPKWVKIWGSIVGAMISTFVVIGKFTDVFNKSDPPKPIPINVVLPDREPTIVPMLRHIDDGVKKLKDKMGIKDTIFSFVGEIDSTEIVEGNSIGGK